MKRRIYSPVNRVLPCADEAHLCRHPHEPSEPRVSRVAIILLAGLLAGCGTLSTEVYRGYSGPDLADDALATVELGSSEWVEIDDVRVKHTEYGSLKLLPGSHHILWGMTFGVSFLVDWRMYVPYEQSATVMLEAGHTYILLGDRTTGPGYRVYLWIEEPATGDVLYGSKGP